MPQRSPVPPPLVPLVPLVPLAPFAFGLADERPGSRTWRREGVRATRGERHVSRVDLTALLQGAP